MGRDRDGDGIVDRVDNCILHHNIDQANHDLDEFGDACDYDDDSDDIPNLVDNCQFVANIEQTDSNGE